MSTYHPVIHLREQREHRRLTQDQLAERADVGVATIRRIELGLRLPPLLIIAKLAAALDVHPRRLLDWRTD